MEERTFICISSISLYFLMYKETLAGVRIPKKFTDGLDRRQGRRIEVESCNRFMVKMQSQSPWRDWNETSLICSSVYVNNVSGTKFFTSNLISQMDRAHPKPVTLNPFGKWIQSNSWVYSQFTALNPDWQIVADWKFLKGSLCIAMLYWGLDMTGELQQQVKAKEVCLYHSSSWDPQSINRSPSAQPEGLQTLGRKHRYEQSGLASKR